MTLGFDFGGKADVAGLRLVVDDTVFEGWISAEVERTLDEFVPRYSLKYADRWAPDQKPWQIRKGAAARLLYDDELLIDGFVTTSRIKIGPGSVYDLSANGRGKTCDLVDCSATHKTGHWQNVTATKIVNDLLTPYGLSATCNVLDTEIYPRFALEAGETVHAAIDRVCKVRALVPFTKPDGNVILLQISPAGPAVELEVSRAISKTLEEDEQDTYSDYLLRNTGVGTAAEALTQAAIIDPNVTRFRPLVIVGDAPANTAQAAIRAQWECNVRAGRSERLIYEMPGALSSTGDTYQPGQRFKIKDTDLGVDEVMIVVRALLRSGEKELITEVHFARPESYMQLAYPKKKLSGTTKRGKAIKHQSKRPI